MDTTTWTKVKLGDICTIKTGKLNANKAVENGEYPFFTCAEEVARIDTYAFDCDALLIAGNGNVGMIHSYTGKFNAYQRTYVLSNFKFNKGYIEQYLRAKLPDRVKEHIKGSAVPYIKLDCLSDMDILIPEDTDTQLKIANALSTLDTLISTTEQKSDVLRKQKAQLMTDIFSSDRERADWSVVKLGDIAKFTKGRNPKVYSDESGRPIVGAHEIDWSTNIYEKYTGEDLPSCVEDEVLILWDGSKAGKCGIGHNAILSSTIMKLTIHNKSIYSPMFLFYKLTSMKDKIEDTKHGAAIPHLDRKAIEGFDIDVPPLPEQQQIAKLLSEYDELIAVTNEQADILKKSKTQIMTDIFA